MISAIIAKDIRLFSRDRFFLWVSVAGLVLYAVLFWVLPDTVDETLSLGIYAPGGELAVEDLEGTDGQGISFTEYEDERALREAVEEGETVVAGLAFNVGVEPSITVYVASGVPDAVAGAVEGLAAEIAYLIAGVEPPVSGFSTEQIVLGEDRAGDQFSLQDKFRPLLAFFVLMIESMALATLVAAEIQDKTVKAISVTPARVADFLTAKAVFGTLLAFVQVVVLMIAIRSLSSAPVLLLVAVFLGSVLVTGFGLLAGSVGKDYVSIIFWSMLFLVPMLIPAMAFIFPGSTAGWIKALPSYPLAKTMVDVTSYGAGWADVAGLLLILAAWGIASLAVGWKVLGRRVQTL